MTLIDTSAWVEFLRDTGSQTCNRVEELLEETCIICEPIAMELLAGARDELHVAELRRLIARCITLKTESVDYEMAASIFRSCRRGGKTPRKLIDCLIAAIALRHEVALLHSDADFTVIAESVPLRLA
jgi:predicted nucleic acid-binding protein